MPRENRRLARSRTAELLARCSRERFPAESGVSDEECPLGFTTAVYPLTTPVANSLPVAHSELTMPAERVSLSVTAMRGFGTWVHSPRISA